MSHEPWATSGRPSQSAHGSWPMADGPASNRQSPIGNSLWTLLLDPQPRPGWANMALDQSLLDEAERTGEGFVRLYRWEPWCLSFGRHEPALRRYDRAQIEALGLDTVRRPTGGRAVWHARELTYAVAAPLDRFPGAGRLGAAAYRAIHGALAQAVTTLGGAADLASDRPAAGVGSGACFALAAGGEVVARGRKLAGSAQLRQGGAFLQHGSLLLEDDQSLVADVSVGPVPAAREITLREALGRPVDFAEAAAAVAAAFRAWTGEWNDGVVRPEQVERHAPRFRDAGWTWQR